MITAFRDWLSIQLIKWAIDVCPYDDMKNLIRMSINTATDSYLMMKEIEKETEGLI